MILQEKQTANALLMVRPTAFGYNPETAVDNAFQNKGSMDSLDIQENALAEFDSMVSILRENRIRVLVVEDTLASVTPDSIFPNNWFTTHEDGRVAIYPLKAENRREERRPEVFEYLIEEGFTVKHIEDFTDAENEGRFLEGTGSLVLDRLNKLCYISVSERSNPELVVEFCEVFGYQPVFFQSVIENQPVYHTNVSMNIGEHFAMVAVDSFSREDEREKALNALEVSGKEVIHLSDEQVLNFAGNGLELKNQNNQSCFILSRRAYSALSKEQIDLIGSYSKIITPDLETIENVGGGSARCMMAEIFLPYQRK